MNSDDFRETLGEKLAGGRPASESQEAKYSRSIDDENVSPIRDPGSAAGASEDTHTFFTIDSTQSHVTFSEGGGNGFHLAPIVRKYTSARLQVTPGRGRITTVESNLLYDALGLLRSLAYDVNQFTSAAEGIRPPDMSAGEVRYRCFRLARQASNFGVRLPRAGSAEGGAVCVPGLDVLIEFLEKRCVGRWVVRHGARHPYPNGSFAVCLR